MNAIAGLLLCASLLGQADGEVLYLANIVSPAEGAEVESGKVIPVHAVIIVDGVEGMSPIAPNVVVELLAASDKTFVTHQSGIAEVKRDAKRTNRFDIHFDLKGPAPFPPREYLLRVHCCLDKILATPSRRVRVTEAAAAK